MIFAVIVTFLSIAYLKKVDVYNTFIDGAKEGFDTSIKLIPYLLAMLVAIGVLRASGVLDMIVDSFRYVVLALGGNAAFVDALPTAMMKPLSAQALEL